MNPMEKLKKAFEDLEENEPVDNEDLRVEAQSIPFTGNHEYEPDMLACPCCGAENLHPTDVVRGKDLNIRPEYADYTQLNFWCEHCPNDVGLRFRFHKGTTMMTWQINEGVPEGATIN